MCDGYGQSDGIACQSGDAAPTCESEDVSSCDSTDPTDPTDPDPGDDWEAPITYDGWVCYTTAEGDYRCQGGVSMLDYREQFTKLYDQNSYNLYRILDNSSDIAKLSSNVSNVQTSVESVYGTANETLVETREITKKVDALKDELTNLDVDLSDLDPKFAEIQSTLSDHASTSTSQFYRLMDYVAPLNGKFGEVNGNIQTLNSAVTGLIRSVGNDMDHNDSLVQQNGQAIAELSDNLSTLSGDVSGLADGLEALSSQISGAGSTGGDVDLSGVESKLQGIQETLDGKGLVGRPFEGQVDFEGNGLYGSDAIDKLQGEIEQLQEQYQEQMGQFKSLFTFDESQLNSGEYVKHEWTFTFANGRTNSFSSGVFPALLQNANFIAAVLLFLAVLLGIKALTD
ncbi:hypothetical protein LZT09_13010 [Vibrio fluvialis]|uniref:hypothetical protein n=1 Tax=Vibrio fluvialis TaxID=676 RepID=UPI001F35DED0|nr:hypothetical protein [Vibrio fluvialis]MCE7615544.1 hypothetical protein [Vibrio fluvialis]